MKKQSCPRCGRELPHLTNNCTKCGKVFNLDRPIRPNTTKPSGCLGLFVAVFGATFVLSTLSLWKLL